MNTTPNNTITFESLGPGQFIKVPLSHQETPYTCGVACVQSILASYGIIYTQDILSEHLKQKPIYGTEYNNIISFMKTLGFQASFHIEMSLDFLKELIDHGITPLLILQAWKEDAIEYTYVWNNPHYVIACGYDETQILFMDPWTFGSYAFLSTSELMPRWHTTDHSGNHYYCTGLIIKHEQLPFIYKPNIMKRMG